MEADAGHTRLVAVDEYERSSSLDAMVERVS